MRRRPRVHVYPLDDVRDAPICGWAIAADETHVAYIPKKLFPDEQVRIARMIAAALRNLDETDETT